MKLAWKEYRQFLRATLHLNFYVAKKEKFVPSHFSFADFKALPMEEKLAVRDHLNENLDLAEEYRQTNPDKLPVADLDVLKGYRHLLQGSFLIVDHTKAYSVFLLEGKAYGVIGLGSSIAKLMGRQVPQYVSAALLPYHGKIVFDGFLLGTRIQFGKGLSDSLTAEYRQVKARYGIITELPFEEKKKEENYAELLEFYMENADNRVRFCVEIEELLEIQPELEGLYYQLWGKIHVRAQKKQLKSLGIKGQHVGIIGETIIAMAPKPGGLEEALAAILPADKLSWVYRFKV